MLVMETIGALGLILLVWGVILYNKLIRNSNLVKEGWSGIDVQLKRRADLIPNLVEIVKGYMAHERGIVDMVVEKRAVCFGAETPKARGAAEGELTGALNRLFALAENYPDLKASEQFRQLQDSLSTVEDEIQLARRYYNGTVRDLNIMVEAFPSNLIAGRFGFEQADYFELEEQQKRESPDLNLKQGEGG